MKMNYLSGGKKSILGTRLSSRYLSSDAFTSSAGKTSGRSISRLGSLFGRKGNTNKRFSGTGQRVGLFEFRNIFFKSIIVAMCLVVIGYTLPFTRYTVHSFFVTHMSGIVYPVEIEDDASDTLEEHEMFVSPVFGTTDRFVYAQTETMYPEGSLVYASEKNVLIGTLSYASSSRPYVVLLSEVGQKHNLFIKNVSQTILDTVPSDTEESTTTMSTSSQHNVNEDIATKFSTAVFEGFGYGQMRAQVPPQEEIAVDTILYIRTEYGLTPAARVSYIEKDTGSTFTNIYAQLLVAPFQLYKVRIGGI